MWTTLVLVMVAWAPVAPDSFRGVDPSEVLFENLEAEEVFQFLCFGIVSYTVPYDVLLYTCVNMNLDTFMQNYVHTCAHTCTFIHNYVHTCAHTRAHLYTHLRTIKPIQSFTVGHASRFYHRKPAEGYHRHLRRPAPPPPPECA